ncbi:MAG: PAS domain-containing protein [Ferrovibrio sp.]
MIMQFKRQIFSYHDSNAEVGISHPRLQALFDLWNDKRGSRQAPPRSDFSHEELRPWFGHLMLLDCLGDSEYRYRLYGTELVRMFGFDLTGKTVRASTSRIGDKPLAEYEKVMRIGAPVYTSRISPSAREYLQVDKLALPLMEGGIVTRILGAIYLSDSESE